MAYAYYNEFDPKAAAWLRELIKQGHIADGEVDTRSIEDVTPDDLRKFTQCHFFAGIGVWSYSLRRAGWPDDRPVWTGSCPCQPFSAAGKGDGFDDERHLWPAFFHLVRQSRPAVIFGEQVASKDGLAWLDLVHADLEGTGYSVGALDLCAAGFGAPHIRQRIFFVAHSGGIGPERGRMRIGGVEAYAGRETCVGRGYRGNAEEHRAADNAANNGVALGDTKPTRLEGHGGDVGNGNQPGRHGAHAAGSVAEAGAVGQRVDDSLRDGRTDGSPIGRSNGPVSSERESVAECSTGSATYLLEYTPSEQVGLSRCARESGSAVGELANPDGRNTCAEREQRSGQHGQQSQNGGATGGFWHPADWLPCRDGKWRPVEPGTFPLAHGAPARVGRLRGYGNAIVAPVAQGFIEAYLDL